MLSPLHGRKRLWNCVRNVMQWNMNACLNNTSFVSALGLFFFLSNISFAVAFLKAFVYCVLDDFV